MEKMKQQAGRFGAEYLATKVSEVDLKERPFKVVCENGDQFLADSLIISTGASAKYSGASPRTGIDWPRGQCLRHL